MELLPIHIRYVKSVEYIQGGFAGWLLIMLLFITVIILIHVTGIMLMRLENN